jgi:putative transposase
MSRQRYTPKRIIGVLREAALTKGQTAARVSRTLGIAAQTCWRWRREYSGLKVEQARRLQALEQEEVRRQRAGADLTLDQLIWREAVQGNF